MIILRFYKQNPIRSLLKYNFMHDIEPFFGWEFSYDSNADERSPFYQAEYETNQYTNTIYGYYIHPYWDFIGSETLYVKVLMADYHRKFVIIEFLGEWNDTLHNDIMHLKRNVIDYFTGEGINHFILIGENILTNHGSDDEYYEEWFEDGENGWIVLLNFREFVLREMNAYNLDSYLIWGGILDELDNWRTTNPHKLFEFVRKEVEKRIALF